MNKKIISKLLLVLMALMMSVSIVTGISSCTNRSGTTAMATPDEATRDTAVHITETVVTEPTTTAPTADRNVEHLMCVDIQYKTFKSVDDAKSFAESVSKAIELITAECESTNYTAEELELIKAEKIRLEEIYGKVLSDIDAMLKEDTKTETTTKPSSNKKPSNKPTNKPSESNKPVATPDEARPSDGKYKHATKVWNHLKNKGYSDAVCAGIMGNFMTETGGHTLNIKPNDYSSNGRYYGIAQWSSKYYPEVHGKDLDYQLNFLSKTIKKEFNTYGHLYKKGFDYNDFLSLDSPRDAALAFAKVYERCGSGSYSKRQSGAEKALSYFT